MHGVDEPDSCRFEVLHGSVFEKGCFNTPTPHLEVDNWLRSSATQNALVKRRYILRSLSLKHYRKASCVQCFTQQHPFSIII